MDRRDMMAMFPRDDDGFCEKEMTFHIEVENCFLECSNFEAGIECDCGFCADDEGSEIHVFPARYEVCRTCDGKGKHVNPSIDAHGISRDEFDDDPGFEEDYFSGVYDVECYECHGRRVVPKIDDSNLNPRQLQVLKVIQNLRRDNQRMDEMSYLERMMGA